MIPLYANLCSGSRRYAGGRIESGYTRTAIALHWIVAAGLLFQVALGVWMLGIPENPPGVQAGWFNLHKSIGITIGLIVIARLVWRFTHRPPDLPLAIPRWQRAVAKTIHAALYACVLVVAVSGYVGSSFTKYPIKFFGQTLPNWGWHSPQLKSVMSDVHYAAVVLLMVLVAIHVSAALKHLIIDRDEVFRRMWNWPR